MRKVLPLFISAALFFATTLPYIASAQACTNPDTRDVCPVGYVCNWSYQCELRTVPVNTNPPPIGNTSPLQPVTVSSGGLNTALLETWSDDVIYFINAALVPLLTAIAFIVFLYGVFKYFILGADSEDKRTEGRTFILYGIIGFVIIFSLWGLVNVGIELLNVGTGPRAGSLQYPTL